MCKWSWCSWLTRALAWSAAHQCLGDGDGDSAGESASPLPTFVCDGLLLTAMDGGMAIRRLSGIRIRATLVASGR
ncbi:hypothetical protein Micbo1qcDRAFT_15986 [Microdochium bolleyi]|uniref:Secreted protein n=1 Tax=Microdochium bolleyi TaxID=196109 RepID=A0A136IV31_9PEZI|nr:hypothetical protein Micbo1qcDRAFT_15986 [Microdochium bolleyi]